MIGPGATATTLLEFREAKNLPTLVIHCQGRHRTYILIQTRSGPQGTSELGS